MRDYLAIKSSLLAWNGWEREQLPRELQCSWRKTITCRAPVFVLAPVCVLLVMFLFLTIALASNIASGDVEQVTRWWKSRGQLLKLLLTSLYITLLYFALLCADSRHEEWQNQCCCSSETKLNLSRLMIRRRLWRSLA